MKRIVIEIDGDDITMYRPGITGYEVISILECIKTNLCMDLLKPKLHPCEHPPAKQKKR